MSACGSWTRALTHRPYSAKALAQVIAERRAAGGKPLNFAVVYPMSTHAYELRYWLAAAGIDPDRDVNLLVVPPPQMVTQLKAGHIDGFCVGEPWSSVAVAEGLGRVLITNYELWNNNPEKVFGVNLEWAEQYPRTHGAVLAALLEAARWTDALENRPAVAEMIAQPRYVNAPVEIVAQSMTGTFRYALDEPPVRMPDFNVFFRFAATYPWRSHALWFLTRWCAGARSSGPSISSPPPRRCTGRTCTAKPPRPGAGRADGGLQDRGQPCPRLDAGGRHRQPGHGGGSLLRRRQLRPSRSDGLPARLRGGAPAFRWTTSPRVEGSIPAPARRRTRRRPNPVHIPVRAADSTHGELN
jgi:hypothetical protein